MTMLSCTQSFSCPSFCRKTIFLTTLLAASTAIAADFGVSPIRLDFDHSTRSGAVTVSNDDAEKNLQLQVRLFSWTQDAEGKDQYTESEDLAYFPQMLNLPPKEQRLVRAGMKEPAVETEKTYRLFIEEMPEPNKGETKGAQVAVAVRFGVPIFVKPQQVTLSGEIASAELNKGTLKLQIKNTGNSHFRIQTLNLSADGFKQEIAGWYLLAGASKNYSATLPADVCRKLDKLTIAVKTDDNALELSQTLTINHAQCQ